MACAVCFMSLPSCNNSNKSSDSGDKEIKITKDLAKDSKTYVDLALTDYLRADLYYESLCRVYGDIDRKSDLKDECAYLLASKSSYKVTYDPLKDASACITYRIWDFHEVAEMILRDIIWKYQDKEKDDELYRVITLLENHLEGSWLDKMLNKYL